jgi:hypothetical protein
MHAHAVPLVEPPSIGVHLIWIGPRPWLYSPGGWFIQRRVFKGRGELVCDSLSPTTLNELRVLFELRLSLGVLTYRQGFMPAPLEKAGASQGVKGEVFTYHLREPQPFVQVNLTGSESLAFGLRGGKVVAVSSTPPVSGNIVHVLSALAIETVVVYARDARAIQFCIQRAPQPDDVWENEPFIVKELQLPLAELMPALTTPAEEFAEAASRIPSGTALDAVDFRRLANTLRVGVRQAGPPRPVDQVLLLREQAGAEFEELIALDPLRVMVAHPVWRPALGFGFFDQDPALVVGDTYEYRITGRFPAEDLEDTVYGFHTIPSQTLLPAEFYLHDLHLLAPQPVRVERAPGAAAGGLRDISRRGIRLLPPEQDFWQLPFSLEEWSLVIDFPEEVTAVILELHQREHDLEYAWKAAGGSLGGPKQVSLEANPRLDFPEPVRQLRLAGKGFLFAIRIPRGPKGLLPVSIVLPPVRLQNTPPPAPPLLASIRNLQQPLPASDSDHPDPGSHSRHALGFQVDWRPAPQEGIFLWPAEENAAPPIDAALYQIEHRQVTLAPDGSTIIDATEWTAVLSDENWVAGDRDEGIRSIRIHPRIDLMQVYPEEPRRSAGAGADVFYRDVFDFEEGGGAAARPVPPPGTFHQYRVRAVDAIGRASPGWTETNVLRLEKRVPPPVPAGPDRPPEVPPRLPSPTGVQARVLVKGSPDLTAAEETLLGGDENAIVLRWGWREEQRSQDPFAREFRVYVSDRPLNAVPGQLTGAVTLSPGVYAAALNLERAVVADAARGLTLNAGYPFHIAGHTAGSAVTARLEARVPDSSTLLPQPEAGHVELPLRLTPTMTQPPAWSERFEVQPITAATTYQAVLRNRFTLSPEQPRGSVWVGVSAADDQGYVEDQMAPAETRPGNESAIVPVLCEARFHGRPVFSVPPALDPVPTITTPEPDGRPLLFDLDLRPTLEGSGLSAGDFFRAERLSADALVSAYFLSPANAVMARAVDPRDSSETAEEVVIPNPADRAAVIAALNEARTSVLEDRFVVFLAGSHPYRDRLFEPVSLEPAPFGPVQETLPPKSGRYVYRVRKSDRNGRLSEGAAMARVIVRVPSLAPGPAPERVSFTPGDPAGRLRLLVPADDTVTHLLAFAQETVPGANGGRPVEEAALLRIPNRPDLYPAGGLWLRAPDGALLTPVVKALSDADVVTGVDGARQAALDFSADPGQRLRVWAYTLTRDGIPSLPAGPWTLAIPPGPLPAPVLTVSETVPGRLSFAWSWPPGPAFEVGLEQSFDGAAWRRISPLLGSTTSVYEVTRPARAASYRLRVYCLDGRAGHSDPLTI